MNQILKGDCLEVMQTIPDGAIGMVLADLPYGVTACHWDKVIDLDALWVQFKRLIQSRRALVFTATQPFTTDLICSNREWFKYCWVWEKNLVTGTISANVRPLSNHEDVAVFGEGKILYQPQKEKYSEADIGRMRKKDYLVTSGSAYGGMKRISEARSKVIASGGMKHPKSVLKIKCVHACDKNKTGHPSEKPVALFEYLIRTYTNPGDVVLDPTAGSMTTAIAALNTGRGYICIEKDPDEYRKGLARVEEHLAKPQQINLLEPTPVLPAAATVQQTTIFDAIGGTA